MVSAGWRGVCPIGTCVCSIGICDVGTCNFGVRLSVWVVFPAPEDGEADASNRCVVTGSCAVAVGDDAFVLFLAGFSAELFCEELFFPEIFWL